MVWGRTSERATWRQRSDALTAAMRQRAAGKGSRGGAAIWACSEAWMPRDLKALLRLSRNTAEKNARGQRGLFEATRNEADPDGFAVFGRYPKGLLSHVVRIGLLGQVTRDEVLHVCSGTLSATERWTVDIRPEAKPRVIADGRALPFRAASVRAVMLDPPYSDQYAQNLYGVENPRPSWLLKEAARVVMPGGRIGMLHVAVPFAPPGCRLVNVYGVSIGVGFRMRALTIYERQQDQLLRG